MEKAYEVRDDVIVIDRELTELDCFVKDFLEVLEKHSDYLIVSGFVSISTGRTRGTEDVDILVLKMNKNKFNELFDALANDFWCYQGDTAEEVYPYIQEMNNIRFAKKGEMFPNIEFIPIDKNKKAKYFELTHPQKIQIKDFRFKIPPIEFEIAYKEIMLGSDKDITDAKHLREFFADIINEEKLKEYELMIRDELK